MSVSMRAIDSGVPQRFQSSDGRHVGHDGESRTILPFACGSHFTNSVLSRNFGSTIASALTGLPFVPGLQASIVPSSERTRGCTRSMCDTPRRQPRHVPYCSRFKSWGIDAKREQYGTRRGWRRGVSHIDLVQPRVRSLEGTMLAWSPGTNGRPVSAEALVLPKFRDSTEFVKWLPP